MKKLSMLFIFIFIAITAFAQQPAPQQPAPMQPAPLQPASEQTLSPIWSLKAGFNYSSITNDKVKDNDDYSSVFGFQIGVAANIGLRNFGANMLYFQPGLMFITKGHSYSYSKKEVDDEYREYFGLSEEATWKLYYIELPLMAVLRIPVGENLAIALNAGPYFAFGLSGTKTYEWEGFGEEASGEIDLFDENVQRERLGRFDAGLGLGAGIEYKQFYIGINYDIGIKDLAYNSAQVGGSNRTFGVNLGYKFGQTPKEEPKPPPPVQPQPLPPPPPPPQPEPVAQPEPQPEPILAPPPPPELPQKSEKDSLLAVKRMEVQKKFEALNSKSINVYKDARGTILSLSDILFESGKATLKPELRENLAEIAAILKNMLTDANIIVEGHTDNVGSEEKNHKLSADRAYAVMKYLVDRGVSQERLSSRGYGFAKPIADNETKEGRAKNRRVELIIQEPEPEPVIVPVPVQEVVPEQPVPQQPIPQEQPQALQRPAEQPEQPPPPPPPMQEPQAQQQPVAPPPQEAQLQQVQQQPEPEKPAFAKQTITVDVVPTVIGFIIGSVGKSFIDGALEDMKDEEGVTIDADISGIGFALQYEYQFFERMSLAARFAYLGLGATMNSKDEISHDEATLKGDLSLMSIEGHLRTYPFAGAFFLDVIFGYVNLSLSFKGEDFADVDSDIPSVPAREKEEIKFDASQGFFKTGLKLGWRVSFGNNAGFTFEPAFNFCYGMRMGGKPIVQQIIEDNKKKYDDDAKDIDKKLKLGESVGLIGGPGFSMSFGYRF
jgi:outer membrane protein OmpA-like peptidoglycan-associated protein